MTSLLAVMVRPVKSAPDIEYWMPVAVCWPSVELVLTLRTRALGKICKLARGGRGSMYADLAYERVLQDEIESMDVRTC